MYKEFIIILIVIVLIISLDILSNNYTKKSVEILSVSLDEVKENVLNEERKIAKEKMQNVESQWKQKYYVLAYYIEHDELEKIETEITGLSSLIDVEEYKQCIEKLYTTKFLLNHIEQKEKFSIQNIF